MPLPITADEPLALLPEDVDPLLLPEPALLDPVPEIPELLPEPPFERPLEPLVPVPELPREPDPGEGVVEVAVGVADAPLLGPVEAAPASSPSGGDVTSPVAQPDAMVTKTND
jgi:hypothetical protein